MSNWLQTVVDICTSSLCALIVADGWMLPREAEIHSTLLQFTQQYEYLATDSGGYVYEQPSRINCSIWLDASQRSRDGV